MEKLKNMFRVLAALVALTAPAKALDFYVGFPAGGGYDIYSRVFVKHLDRYLPNENIVIKNQPGASSLNLTNWLAQTDEQVIGMINSSMITHALLKQPNASYDATKLHWLGSLNNEILVCFVRKDSGITGIDQGAILGVVPEAARLMRFVNELTNARFKVITGYPGTNDINLAIDRNEIQGNCPTPYASIKTQRPQWIKDNSVTWLMQFSTVKHPELKNVPLIEELLIDKKNVEVVRLYTMPLTAGRPIVASAASKPEFVKRMRDAIDRAAADPQFLAEAQKINLDIDYVKGEDIQNMVKYLHNADPAVINRVMQFLK